VKRKSPPKPETLTGSYIIIQPAARQYAGPLALLNFVVNETASFFRYFSRQISTWKRN
jgi:hypothetical protein